MAAAKALRPRKEPLQERSRLTVEAVLDAALQVFEQHGYAAGTTARIAERAGISVGSLYQYFPNKDAILVALASRHIDELRALGATLISGQPDASLREFLQQLVQGFVFLHLQNPQVHRLLVEELTLPAETREAFDQLSEEMARRLEAALGAQDELQGADHAKLAYFVGQSLEFMTHNLVLHTPPRYAHDDYVAEVVCLIEGYVRLHTAQARA